MTKTEGLHSDFWLDWKSFHSNTDNKKSQLFMFREKYSVFIFVLEINSNQPVFLHVWPLKQVSKASLHSSISSQVLPSPSKPNLHRQVYEPLLFWQVAWLEQAFSPCKRSTSEIHQKYSKVYDFWPLPSHSSISIQAPCFDVKPVLQSHSYVPGLLTQTDYFWISHTRSSKLWK